MRTSTIAVVSQVVHFYVLILGVETAKAGPYTIEYQKIEQCEDVGTNKVGLYNLTKEENGNYKVQFHLGSPMDEHFKLCVEAQEFFPDGFTKLHQFNCHDCDHAWMYLGDLLTNVMISSGIEPRKCIFPKGQYTATNWNASQQLRYIPRLNYNDFIVKISYFVEDMKIGCNLFYAKINPQQ